MSYREYVEKEDFDNMTRSYRRACKRNGVVFQQPSWNDSYGDGDGTFWLSNSNGTLATFDIVTTYRLRRK